MLPKQSAHCALPLLYVTMHMGMVCSLKGVSRIAQ